MTALSVSTSMISWSADNFVARLDLDRDDRGLGHRFAELRHGDWNLWHKLVICALEELWRTLAAIVFRVRADARSRDSGDRESACLSR